MIVDGIVCGVLQWSKHGTPDTSRFCLTTNLKSLQAMWSHAIWQKEKKKKHNDNRETQQAN